MAKFDVERFRRMMRELAPHAARMEAIVEKYWPNGSLPHWEDILAEDPDIDLGVSGDDSHNDVWNVLGEAIGTVASFAEPAEEK